MDAGTVPVDVQTHQSTPADSFRNRVAGRLANLALSLGTPEYRRFISGAILYGMSAAARDVVEGNEPPTDWMSP